MLGPIDGCKARRLSLVDGEVMFDDKLKESMVESSRLLELVDGFGHWIKD